MKRLSLLFALLCLVGSVQAQQWRLMSIDIDSFVWVNLPQGPTSYHFRHWQKTEFTYDHSTVRGSSLNNDSIAYDKKYIRIRESFTSNHYKRDDEYYRYYDSQNHLLEELRYVLGGTHLQHRDSFYYDSLGNVIEKVWYDTTLQPDTSYLPQYKFTYTYDSMGRLLRADERTWKNSAFDPPHSIFIRAYDSLGGLIKDSVSYTKGGAAPSIYYYENTYDSQNRIIAKLKYIYNTSLGKPTLHTRYYYTYDALGRLIKDSSQISFSGYEVQTHAYKYDSQNRLITDTFYRSKFYRKVNTYYYTNFGYLSEVRRTYMPAPNYKSEQDYTGRTRYTYSYWPLSVASASQNDQGQLLVFPNPANNILQLQWSSGVHSEKVQGRIVDIQGNIVGQWEDAGTEQYHKYLPISHLAAGLYIVELQTGGKAIRKRFEVAK
ncbi:MAG: T9SS type A sorting domain-containing protein [Flavipsychrobacter sp.]